MRLSRALPSAALVLVLSNHLMAADPSYGFKVDQPVFYEVKVTEDLPGGAKTTLNYLKYRPSALNSEGQITLRHDWSQYSITETRNGGAQTVKTGLPLFLSGPQPGDDTPGSETVIDARGLIVNVTNPPANRQLDCLLGPVYGIALLPLPPAGQSNWTAQRQVMAYSESVHQEPGGMWGHHDVTTRVERMCKENITYTSSPVSADGLLTVQQTYDLASDNKVGDTPIDHLSGNGTYVFDTNKGVIKTYDTKLTYALAQENVSIKIPVTVAVRLLDGDDLAKLKSDADELAAKVKKSREDMRQRDADREKAEALGAKEVCDLPEGMSMTKSTPGKGGSPFIRVNLNGRPVIGFAVKLGSWGGKQCIREVQPLYDAPNPTDQKDTERQLIVAKDGYALGGLWVNIDDTNVIALRLIFMKKTDKGVDTKSAYVSPWVGTLSGSNRVRFGGTGQTVAGIFGRQGLNTDAIGLVMQDSDPTDDPNFKGAAPAKDPTDDPNFKG